MSSFTTVLFVLFLHQVRAFHRIEVEKFWVLPVNLTRSMIDLVRKKLDEQETHHIALAMVRPGLASSPGFGRPWSQLAMELLLSILDPYFDTRCQKH